LLAPVVVASVFAGAAVGWLAGARRSQPAQVACECHCPPPELAAARVVAPQAVEAAAPRSAIHGFGTPDTGDAALIEQAQRAYVKGEYQRAIDLAKRVKGSKREDQANASMIIGACACFQHDDKLATEEWNKLDERGRLFIAYVCKRNGLDVPRQ
jgi:hypothetical protein